MLLTARHHLTIRFLAAATSIAVLWFIYLPATSSLAEAAEQRIRYFHSDHLGSTNLVTDENGNVIERTEYKPFGEIYRREVRNPNTGQLIVGSAAPSVSPYGFTGQRHDSDTGLYFYNARYYDPQLGRFTQPDPIVQAFDDPQFLNRYTYVRNNPINLVDPSGNFAFLPFLGAVLVKALIGAAIGAGTSIALGAATGQIHNWSDVGRLAAVGAASGAVFMGGGYAIGAQGLALSGLTKTVAEFGVATAAGALGGGVDSSLQGGSFGHGALIGAALSGAFYGIAVGSAALAHSPLGERMGNAALGGLKQLANSSAARAIQGALSEGPGVTSEVYAGVRQASAFLKEHGFAREIRKRTLGPLDPKTVGTRLAGSNEYGIRYYDNIKAFARGHWLFDTFPAGRESLAVKFEWNKMLYIKQWHKKIGSRLNNVLASLAPKFCFLHLW